MSCIQAQAQNMEEMPKQVFLNYRVEVKELPGSGRILSQILPLIPEHVLKPENFSLLTYKESPVGYHYLYQYQIQGIPVEGQFVRVFVDKKMTLRQLIWQLRGTHLSATATFGDPEILRQRLAHLKHVGEINKVWKFYPEGWQALLKASVIEDIAAFAEYRFYDANYQEIYQIDNAARFEGKDSMIQAHVFFPDPLTSSQMPYGGAYLDFNDADSPAINNERVWRPIITDFVNDSFYLRDSVFRFAELENPLSQQPVLLGPFADFTRNQQEFEFVNSYYHLQTWIRRVHDLGYPLPGLPIQVDPHAANGADISGFSPVFGDMALLFGEGGIDDAEDADVVVHELGHALSYSVSPGTNNGLERTSFEEGNCDYFAMSYSRQISNFGWEKTFNWDGNVTWQGRVVNTEKVMPANYTSNKYSNAEVWVAALREVYDSVGPDITDRLVLCALYNQVTQMTFAQMANNCLQCDSILNNGVNHTLIFNAMNSRGLAFPLGFKEPQSSNWSLLNSAGFAFRGEALRVDFGGQTFNGSAEVYDIQGKLLYSVRLDDALYFELDEPVNEKGLYLLRIHSDTNLSVTYRIARH
ncbi:MAG TPA: hypothetical protein DIW47_05700 [Bacteroidetes bacterium]|nr:hypothetical protein [Bacteroidota bacterium]